MVGIHVLLRCASADILLADFRSGSLRVEAGQAVGEWRGMLNDAKLAGHPGRVEFTRLRVPLLLLSAVGDRFGTAPTAQAIARQVPRDRLVVYPSGGHILVGHQQDSAAETKRFIRAHRQSG